MPPSSIESIDLLELKFLPAWVKESSQAKSYEHYEGDPLEDRPGRRNRPPPERDQRFGERKPSRKFGKKRERDARALPDQKEYRHGRDRHRPDRHQEFRAAPPQVTVQFLPHPPAFENVVEQIKSNSVAYSLFSLARLFLQKPERYDVRLRAKPESPLYQLGENGLISADLQFLETNAFRLAKQDFYQIDITQSEPIKGNFSSVALCKLSGTLLGPTNHHGYQPRLRSLYEERFSRRMSFVEYQRQIEIVIDLAAVERWKEETRKITTFTTLSEETPATFGNATEAERHFRQNYLPGLVRRTEESTIDGVTSRQLADRRLHRLIEDVWSAETRSPSHMMQELAKGFREAGLQIFRHRRGMLFISPIRARALAHEQTSVSPQVKAILETLAAHRAINRKELAEKVIVDLAGEEAESRKLALASDLRWLISEGYVIEFNDGALDLPRAKAPSEKNATALAGASAGATSPAEGEVSAQ